jgi:hypothetical protein
LEFLLMAYDSDGKKVNYFACGQLVVARGG